MQCSTFDKAFSLTDVTFDPSEREKKILRLTHRMSDKLAKIWETPTHTPIQKHQLPPLS